MSTVDILRVLRIRAQFIKALREFFDNRRYLEVETPILSPYLLPEPSLEVFATRYTEPEGFGRDLYLIPSPELWMKRLISLGAGSIYQITKCFRNREPRVRTHHPEFTMIEWYTMGCSYTDSISITEDLFAFLIDRLELTQAVDRDQPHIDLRPPFTRLSMRDAFGTYAGVELERVLSDDLRKSELADLGIDPDVADTPEQRFNRILLLHVEPSLPPTVPVILYDYPRIVPTFARTKTDDPACAERWELYAGGIEIANCYTEEHRPEKLRTLLAEESERKRQNAVAHPVDPAFADLLPAESTDISGVALGVDRLLMVMAGFESIEHVIFFPFSSIF